MKGDTAMEIKPATSASLSFTAAQGESEESTKAIRDTFTISDRDISPDGKLVLIMQSKGRDDYRSLKETCENSGLGRCTSDLEIINGFTYELDPANLTALLKTLPDNVEITVDHSISFQPPMPGLFKGKAGESGPA